MTDKEILDGNKLIAEFMGGTLDNPKAKYYYFLERGRYEMELKYHSSWDWLIPVIGKITSECEEPEELGSLRLHLITNDILYAWKFVVNYLSDKQ